MTELKNDAKIRVVGMTCGHCKSTVGDAAAAVAGVREVNVDLAAGTVLARGNGIDVDAIKSAIVEAGYEIASDK